MLEFYSCPENQDSSTPVAVELRSHQIAVPPVGIIADFQ